MFEVVSKMKRTMMTRSPYIYSYSWCPRLHSSRGRIFPTAEPCLYIIHYFHVLETPSQCISKKVHAPDCYRNHDGYQSDLQDFWQRWGILTKAKINRCPGILTTAAGNGQVKHKLIQECQEKGKSKDPSYTYYKSRQRIQQTEWRTRLSIVGSSPMHCR